MVQLHYKGIPSVDFLTDIPETIEGSFHCRKVFVGLKDSTFEHSPYQTYNRIESGNHFTSIQPLLVLYMDGGPDHRLTYASVQQSLLALFI